MSQIWWRMVIIMQLISMYKHKLTRSEIKYKMGKDVGDSSCPESFKYNKCNSAPHAMFFCKKKKEKKKRNIFLHMTKINVS